MKKNLCFLGKSLMVSVLFCLRISQVVGQDSRLDTLESRFLNYNSTAPQEKIFLHTDRAFYMSGEILWFKAYLVDEMSHQPASLSKVAYVEVLDTANTPILQGKIALQDGKGSGSFYVPVSTKSGYYTIRAYTNWMKNSEPDFYFKQSLTIVNPFSTLNLPAIDTARHFDVQFFPEGGNLVAGLESKVGFKAIDKTGKGIQCSGVIINQNQDTITKFQPLKFGMGNFVFTPESDQQYSAIIEIDSTKYTYDIPAASREGYVMQVSETGNEQISVKIQATNPNAAAYLLVHTRQVMKTSAKVSLQNGKADFTFNKSDLGDGISHITLFNQELQPICERLYFKSPSNTLQIEATVQQPQFSTREQVSVQLQTSSAQGNPVPINASMAVYRLDSLPQFQQSDLLSYMWLTSELKGNIESPGYYFNQQNADLQEAMDNLLLTQGWRRFKWEQVLAQTTPSFAFIPEYEGAMIQGRLTDKTSGAAAESIKLYMSVPGRNFHFYSSKSYEDGATEFITKKIYGSNNLYFHTNTKYDSTYTFKLTSPFSDAFDSAKLPDFDLSENTRKQIQQRSMSMQVQNIYAENKINQFAKLEVDTMPFYGIPDRTYLLDDYTRFPTMEEVMREYVQEVMVRKHKGQFEFKIVNQAENRFYPEEPLILLNGIPVFNTNNVISFDPLNIKRLDVVHQKFILNKTVFNGIVSYTTYSEDISWFQPDAHAIKIAYEGLQQQRVFYTPRYETDKQLTSRVPDFRVMLHWAPNLNTDAAGKQQTSFYTSDQPGNYIGIIQGMSAQGTMGSGMFSFEVKPDLPN